MDSGLSHHNRYDWYVVPRVFGSNLSVCTTNVNTVRQENPATPANDLCANAAPLTVTNGFCSQPIKGSLINATFSNPADTAGNCMPLHLRPNDVWYKIIVPSTGNAVLQISRYNSNTSNNFSLMAFSGSCGSLTRIGCAFQNTIFFPNDTASFICRMSIAGRTPGENIFIRVSTASGGNGPFTSSGSYSYFTVGAFDTSAAVKPAIANIGNNCNNILPVTIDSAAGNLFMWVPLLTANGQITAEVHPQGNKMGNVTGGVYVNIAGIRSNNSIYYLDRNLTITPTNLQKKSAGSLLSVRLYAKQNEINSYNSFVNNFSNGNFKINKNNDNCTVAFINPGNSILTVTDTGRYQNDYVLQCNTPSFSSFYFYKNGNDLPLPLQLLSFNAGKRNNMVELNWVTVNEINVSHFEVEKSHNGRDYNLIASLNSNSSGRYSSIDIRPENGNNYYRLKMLDSDGKFTYSYIVKINFNSKYSITVLPNPAHDFITVVGASNFKQAALLDATGKIVRQFTNNATNTFSVSGLAKGIYLLQLKNKLESEIQKIVIE